ncbi:hypothetical protein HPP92_023082 [Vanilla planifolia]|uniref:Glycoside hydrolase family 5 domain-containing protein n=1 Tax=Vanilla planifolia TaxID=51239 RepID=A0A835PPQ6_VANPL|nr:hypothetical protein HPP92_023082 [Vanilla planifolia]
MKAKCSRKAMLILTFNYSISILPLFSLFLVITFELQLGESLPLSTSGSWVVDTISGQRVKLRCVNWAAHLPTVVPEGLDRQPVEAIAVKITSLGFNCLRLTWATYMWTKKRYANLAIVDSLDSLGLHDAAAGIARNNLRILGMTVREAYDAVVQAAADAGLMLVLDNHVSRPMWCCSEDDGNGFFGDADFDMAEWIRGLQIVALRFKNTPEVVGISLRNELRGKRQSNEIWHKNIALGCVTIHQTNPDLLVIVSGLSYDNDLSFLRRHPLRLGFSGKLVYEVHSYAFTDGHRQDWALKPLAPLCASMAREFDERAGFLVRGSAGTPLFVSEFGGDQRGINRGDNRFLSCFLTLAAEMDLDWAIWALQGSYYIRKGRIGDEEMFGVLDKDWEEPRNPHFHQRYGLVQHMLRDPLLTADYGYEIIYHAGSGRCLVVDDRGNVQLGDCERRSRWWYGGKGNARASPIILMDKGLRFCLGAVGEENPVTLTNLSGVRGVTEWSIRMVSGFPFQIVGEVEEGEKARDLCLELDGTNSTIVFARDCICLEGPNCLSDPRPQWFVFISANAR